MIHLNNVNNLDDFVAEARRLRVAADAAEDRFLEFLYEVEQRPDIWASTNNDFLELLQSCGICDPKRYARYRRIRPIATPKVIREIGINAALTFARSADDMVIKQSIREAQHIAEVNGAPLSEKKAQEVRSGHEGREIGKRPIYNRAKSYQDILADNEKLQQRVRELEEENKVLRSSLRKTESALKKATHAPA